MKVYPIKRTTLLVLVFFFTLVLLAGVNYLSMKGGITQNSGPSVITYPWEPTSEEKILPFDYTIPVDPGNNVSVRACPGEYESASFIMTARNDLSDVTIAVSDLRAGSVSTITSDAIDVRLVKVWYQAGVDIWYSTPGSVLTPELLLRDDSLVKVDYQKRINYLNVTEDGSPKYIVISDPKIKIPSNIELHDADKLQPFPMKAGENKQVWMTIHIPEGAPAGNYSGTITVTAASYAPVTMDLKVVVLPFKLEPAPLDYGLFYNGEIFSTGTIGDYQKSGAQYTKEIRNMLDHGVRYPTATSWNDDPSMATLDAMLTVRNQQGLPQDKLFLYVGTGSATTEPELGQLSTKVKEYTAEAAKYGYPNVYFYGIDEASETKLIRERTAWQAVHAAGGNVYAAISGTPNAVTLVGNSLDIAVVAGNLNTTQADLWHAREKKIYSYANPQVGVENPGIYRKNYGFALWNAGYDGAFDFAYQGGYGNIWNDFDGKNYRDHVFAYPTSDGVIDTIEWEGWREGVDDTRYVATLLKHGGNAASIRAMIADSLSKGEDPAQIREEMIDQILLSYPVSRTV